jgi:ferredoxin-type protein NapF
MSMSRRSFLRGRTSVPVPIRPPWSLREAAFVAACTRCDACATSCPSRIVVHGDGGYPVVDFSRGECTFCGECVRACVPAALHRDAAAARPWALAPQIAASCLAARDVVCRTCGDTCPTRAIRFPPLLGRAPQPVTDETRCTGCGACVSACPVAAVTLAAVQSLAMSTAITEEGIEA